MPNNTRIRRALFTPVLLALLAASAAPQTNQKLDVWEPLKFFVGAWEGTSKGQPGQGTCAREYQFALNDAQLRFRKH